MTTAPFKPAWWCRNPHLQTLWPFVFRGKPVPSYQRERLELPDGDFIDIDWLGGRDASPIVVLLHGLEGGSDSHYIRSISHRLSNLGMRCAIMHFRGCSGVPNRLPRGYHSGDTEDLAFFITHLQARSPSVPIAAIGYSLGGNVLLKWCGETGSDCPLSFAVTVSVPFDLTVAAESLESGLARVYQWWLVGSLKRTTQRKIELGLLDYTSKEIRSLNTFTSFDDKITAPLHGFDGAEDYYHRSSSRPYLKRIRIPALLLQAADDPFLLEKGLPDEEELSSTVKLEVSQHGGHVGFVNGRPPFASEYWLDERISDYVRSSFESNRN